jgi:hypothetical protein
MSRLPLRLVLCTLLLPLGGSAADAVRLHFAPQPGDATLAVRTALDAVTARDVVLSFEPGRYQFSDQFAHETYLAITNHDNGLKRIVFALDRFDSVTIEGNGAEFIFQGRVLPFLFQGCQSVTMSGLSIDWDIPYYFQATVNQVDATAGWIEVTPFTDGFSWSVRDGHLQFPDIGGFNYGHLGETLAFDPQHRRVAHGAWDMHLSSTRADRMADGQLRLYANSRHYPEVGTVIVAKGKMGENRYAPAVYGINSSNIRLTDVTVHHALGMGFLFERCDTITLSGCGVFVRPNSPRMVSALADATHFCNCKGDILVENSRFQHMLDDGTNVHGTYVVVDEVLNDRQVRVELRHFQQHGFQFAAPGDELWLIHAPAPGRAAVRTVAAWHQLNERYSVVSFVEPLDNSLRPGDLLENKSWNPSFTMHGCTITDHRARGIVLKTPRPILIENNIFSSMMSAVFLRGESKYWYESGNVEDVLIRNNYFDYCAYSGMDHAVLRVTPRLGDQFASDSSFDRNIRFVGNSIRNFGNRMVWVDRVAGLHIINNTFVQTAEAPVLHPDTPLIELTFCSDVRIEGNVYHGPNARSLAVDPASAASLSLKNNQGFHQLPNQ